MGHTVRNSQRYFDDYDDINRQKKSAGKKKSTRVLNRYVEEDYNDNEDLFDESYETEYTNTTYDNK
jgi:hypothetical protein